MAEGWEVAEPGARASHAGRYFGVGRRPWRSSQPKGTVSELVQAKPPPCCRLSRRGQSPKLLLIMLPDGSN